MHCSVFGWAFTKSVTDPVHNFGAKRGGGRLLGCGRLLGSLRYYSLDH